MPVTYTDPNVWGTERLNVFPVNDELITFNVEVCIESKTTPLVHVTNDNLFREISRGPEVVNLIKMPDCRFDNSDCDTDNDEVLVKLAALIEMALSKFELNVT